LNLVLTFDVSLKANSNASTHTNYLISLLKNDLIDFWRQFTYLAGIQSETVGYISKLSPKINLAVSLKMVRVSKNGA
jgi:hypothetical protein